LINKNSSFSARGALPQPKVTIVILNWNGLGDTLECLGSLAGLCYQNFEIVVIDNGSDPREAEKIKVAFPAVAVLRHQNNLGYAAGNNRGIRHALERGTDYVWLLNNDTAVAPNCLAELVAAAECHQRAGLLSPVIYHYASPFDIQFSGIILDRRQEVWITLKSLRDAHVASQAGPVYLWGTALLVKRQVVDTIGLLDERYFAYHEDLDYCLRATAAGFQTRVVPEAVLRHKSARSLGEDSPVKEYLLVRNSYLLWSTHQTGWRRYTYPRRYLAWVLTRVVAARQAGKHAIADHVLDAAWDAFHGRWGSWEVRRQMPRALRLFLLNYLLAWHPYLWIMLIAGDLKGVTSQAFRRLARRTTIP
jgi:GT2 family glycosyltransferase